MYEKNNPKEVAEIVSYKYNKKGYSLDFSMASLENDIDKILENETPSDSAESAKLEAELTAYIGETLCRNFDAKWTGAFSLDKSGMNFYTCKIHKNGFEFNPSHFVSYYLSNGKQSEGTFKDYLYSTQTEKISLLEGLKQ